MHKDSEDEKLLKEKRRLVNLILDKAKYLNLKQKDLAKVMKITQPRVSDLNNGKACKFSMDILFKINERLKQWKLP